MRTDLLAHRVHVLDTPREPVRPHDASVRGVDELDDDDELAVRRFRRARKTVADPQQSPDVAEIGVGRAQSEGRPAGRDEQPAQTGQVRDQLVGQRVRERRVAFIAADESKRQHRQRRAGDSIQPLGHCSEAGIALRRRIPRVARRGAAARRFGLRHEAVPLAVERLDEALRLAVVAERLPRRLDATRDRGVGHDATVPDLLDDLVFRDEPLAVGDEQREQGKHLRLEAQHLAAGPQLDGGQVQLEATEPIDHRRQE